MRNRELLLLVGVTVLLPVSLSILVWELRPTRHKAAVSPTPPADANAIARVHFGFGASSAIRVDATKIGFDDIGMWFVDDKGFTWRVSGSYAIEYTQKGGKP